MMGGEIPNILIVCENPYLVDSTSFIKIFVGSMETQIHEDGLLCKLKRGGIDFVSMFQFQEPKNSLISEAVGEFPQRVTQHSLSFYLDTEAMGILSKFALIDENLLRIKHNRGIKRRFFVPSL